MILRAELSPWTVYSGEYERLRRLGGHRGFVILCAGEVPGLGPLNAEQCASKLAVRGGQQEQSPGLGLEAGGGGEAAFMLAQGIADLADVIGMDEPDRRALHFVGSRKHRMHGHSAASRIEGFGA